MDTATGSGLMEEFELMKQAKYRVYMQNIDKALKNFEYSSEWADLISALGKLNKVSWQKILIIFGGSVVPCRRQ
jgi:hypothetical protein